MAIQRPKLKFQRGSTYIIDLSDASNAGHPLRFTADSGATEYTHGVTITGTPGQAGAKVTFNVPDSAPENIMYYCTTHGIGMGNKIKTIPYISISSGSGAGGGDSASPDYTDSAVGTTFFLTAIQAYDSDANTYSNELTQLYGNFSDPEAVTTNGEYTCFGEPGMSIYHTGPGTTGNNTIVSNAGWSWILRNRDGALMKSWNGLIKDYDHTNLDMEEVTPSGGSTRYSKYHRAGWANAVRSNENFLFLSCGYRPATMSEPNNNWADDRAFIFVYDFKPPFALRKIIKLEDFNTTDVAHSSTIGYRGGGSGWTEQEFTVGDDWLIVPAAYANYYGNSTYGGRLTYWDISDPDPSNWSSTPDAVIQNPINVVNSPHTTWNGTLYSNQQFGQAGAVIRHNKLTTGHSIHRYTYTKSGNSFSLDTSTIVGPYKPYSYPPYTAWTNDSSSPKFLSYNYGTQGSSTTRQIQLIDPSNSHNADWTLDLNAVPGASYPFGVQPLTVGKDVKIELFSYGDAYRGGNGKAGRISFRKLSDRSEVLALDNPFLRESDGLYFGDNYVHHPIDSDNSNRYSLVAWGEPNDSDTKDIYSFWELAWDSDNGTLALEDPPVAPTWFGDRAVMKHGDYRTSSTYDVYSYASISTQTNAVGFADTTTGRDFDNGNMSNGTRGVYTAGQYTQDIQYITFATLGTVSDFGNLPSDGWQWGGNSASNGVRGFIVGDADTNNNAILQKQILFMTIDTPGNAVDFGFDFNIYTGRGAAASDATYIVAGGGIVPSGLGDVNQGSSDEVRSLGYFGAMTGSSASSFGNLGVARPYLSACSNETRAVFMGGEGNNLNGQPNSDYMLEDIETITVATPGNATDFGDLRRKRSRVGATCNATHGIAAGGQGQPGVVHVFQEYTEIDYFSMVTSGGTATDFGDVHGDQGDHWCAASGNAS